MSVINEASITSLSVRSGRCEQEITKPHVQILSRLVEYKVIVIGQGNQSHLRYME